MNIFNGARVLVTGHTGFKGSWLSLWLESLGANVFGVSDSIPTTPSHFHAAQLSEFIQDKRLNVTDLPAFRAHLLDVKPDFVFHLAAQSLVRKAHKYPVDTWLTNTIGTLNLLESLRGLRSPCVAVFVTSDKSYDNLEWPWGYRETDALGGADPYSASKGAAELAIQSYVRSYFPKDGLIRLGIGRAGNVIGGGDWAPDRIIPDCMRAITSKGLLSIRNPNATRPWQHVLEPLSGYLNLAMELHCHGVLHGEPFNFGPPAEQNHTVGDLISKISDQWSELNWIDESLNHGGPIESHLLKLNCDKALHYLRWHAIWNFEKTVDRTLSWYKNYYDVGGKSVRNFSISQIKEYSQDACKLGMEWAT